MADPRILLVGEVNPLSLHPKFALWPDPPNSSGARLQRIFGLHRETYLSCFERQNLCRGAWSTVEARRQAALIVANPPDVLVSLGLRVAQALGFPDTLFTTRMMTLGGYLIRLPHPSGRCRIWNESGVIAATRRLMEQYAPHVPWGEVGDMIEKAAE